MVVVTSFVHYDLTDLFLLKAILFLRSFLELTYLKKLCKLSLKNFSFFGESRNNFK